MHISADISARKKCYPRFNTANYTAKNSDKTIVTNLSHLRKMVIIFLQNGDFTQSNHAIIIIVVILYYFWKENDGKYT